MCVPKTTKNKCGLPGTYGQRKIQSKLFITSV
jgi:hypothetical protein